MRGFHKTERGIEIKQVDLFQKVGSGRHFFGNHTVKNHIPARVYRILPADLAIMICDKRMRHLPIPRDEACLELDMDIITHAPHRLIEFKRPLVRQIWLLSDHGRNDRYGRQRICSFAFLDRHALKRSGGSIKITRNTVRLAFFKDSRLLCR